MPDAPWGGPLTIPAPTQPGHPVRNDDPRLSGGGLVPTAVKTGAYTAVAGELVFVDASAGPVTVTGPPMTAGAGWGVKKVDASTNVVTAAAASGHTIGGQAAASTTLATRYQVVEFKQNPALASNWAIVGGQLSLASLDLRYATLTDSIVTKTATYTLVDTDIVVVFNTASGAATANLPTAVGRAGKRFLIKKLGGATANPLTIDPNGSETIDGALTEVISVAGGFREIISDGANWQIVGGKVEPVIVSAGSIAAAGTWNIDASIGSTYRAAAAGATLTLAVPTNPIDSDTIMCELTATVATTLTITAAGAAPNVIKMTTGLLNTVNVAAGKKWFGLLRFIAGDGWYLMSSTLGA